ncbi:MAG: phosphatase PAP2 family protein [Halorubrum sp.]
MIPSGVLALAVVLLAATTVGIALVGWVCVGPEQLRTVRDRPEWFTQRVRAVGPYIGALAFVLAVNKGLQGGIERFSHAYGYEATATLHAIEGDLVVSFQSFLPTPATMYFAVVYVVGYAVLLVAPVLVYLFAEQARPMKRLVAAYAVNYAVAVVCYAAVVAYGPRNADRASGGTSADAPLLEYVPDITSITVHVNTNTNVFPSLHAALSVTVLLVAVTTRTEFERWFVVAAVLASSVVVSTMALGIHWATDVVAGIALAAGAVSISGRVVAE